MSKAEKMRNRLASMQKDREEYEKQKKHLEEDMSYGHHHLEKIQKGLKNHMVLNEGEQHGGHHEGAVRNRKEAVSQTHPDSIAGAGAAANSTLKLGINVPHGIA